uniref:FAD-binding PCMH-type domain-containing protein n=1 Tax=Globodera rostochiensis TaxID=31243 RepID=A0A914GWS2_GLORO
MNAVKLVLLSLFIVILFCTVRPVHSAFYCPVERFSGKCFARDEAGDYEKWCYQYASTSMNFDLMQPKLILVAKSVEDVKRAIVYARQQRVNIAVRTGGHQFTGASSTDRDNIQLDLSEAFKDASAGDFAVSRSPKHGVTVRVGISFTVTEFYAMMDAEGLYVPAGQCSNVHLGGHVQTGGYGIAIRAFGLLADHVLAFDIITADGQTLHVARDSADEKMRDLYYAVLGGSPGNFGVLTHITLKAYRNEDYPHSRGFRATFTYAKESVQRILDLMSKMSELERDYDLLVSVLSANTSGAIPPTIAVFAQWSNTGGPNQIADAAVDKWFQCIEAAFGASQRLPDPRAFNWSVPVPLSKLVMAWVYQPIREYVMPYEKRLYLSEWTAAELQRRNWSAWTTGQLDDFIVATTAGQQQVTGVEMVAQLQNIGGPNSTFYRNSLHKSPIDGRDLTSISWRNTTIWAALDGFFNASMNPDAQQFVLSWHKQTDLGALGTAGHVSDLPPEKARRLVFNSFGDRNMGNVWKQYYAKSQYNRLVGIKRTFDPAPTVFTPNNFCVGMPPGKPELPPNNARLPATIFPITSELMCTSGAGAVDAYMTQWMQQEQHTGPRRNTTN